MSDEGPKFRDRSLYDFFQQSADRALELQRDDGSFPPAQNGVYSEPETPVRTTAHWLDLLLFTYKQTTESRYRRAANRAADYLLSEAARPHGYTFYCRKSGSNRCNSLVGPSEPIESLCRAGSILERPDLSTVGIEVFALHPFDDRLGLWQAVEIDGTVLSVDRTLNHQIIFAAAAAEVATVSELAETRVTRFLDRLHRTINLHDDGLVQHYVRPPLSDVVRTVVQRLSHVVLLKNEIASRYYEWSSRRRTKELGYHVTVLSALSKLKHRFPKHDVWECDTIRSALAFTDTPDYRRKVANNEPKYGSVLPSLHHACILHAFTDASEDELSTWINREIERAYDPKTGLFTNDGTDPMFQSALINFATALPNLDITVS